MDVVEAGRHTWSRAELAALPPVLRAGQDGSAMSPTLRRWTKGDDASLREPLISLQHIYKFLLLHATIVSILDVLYAILYHFLRLPY